MRSFGGCCEGEALVNSMDRSFIGKAVWGHAADKNAGIQVTVIDLVHAITLLIHLWGP